jgi:hypothetical protein
MRYILEAPDGFKTGVGYYLAGPMSGYPDFNKPEFRRYHDILNAAGLMILNPAETDGGDTSKSRSYYMRIDTDLIANSGGIILLPHWRDSFGVAFETLLCTHINSPIYEVGLAPNGPDSFSVVLKLVTEDLRALWLFHLFGIDIRDNQYAPVVAVLATTPIRLGPPDGPRLDAPCAVHSESFPIEQDVNAPIPEDETILEEAVRITSGDRRRDYDHARPNHERIAKLWNAWLDVRKAPDSPISAKDAAIMMILLKLGRYAYTPRRDSVVDIAGYARCLAQIDGFEP